MRTIDVRTLLATPGASRRVDRSEALDGLEGEMARVPAHEALRLRLLLESVVEGILVSGPVSGRMRYTCARCLKDFGGEFRIEVTELFTEDAPDEDEAAYRIRDGEIDLEPMIRDAIVLSMPFSPLCRPECLGLCERCGGDRNLGECSCAGEVDPRWAALGDLKLD